MITQKRLRCDFSECVFTQSPDAAQMAHGFLLRFRLCRPTAGAEWETLFSLPAAGPDDGQVLTLAARRVTAAAARSDPWGWCENYAAFAAEDGTVPIVEAALTLHVPYHPEWRELRVGFPLTVYDAVEQDVYFLWDGVRMRLLIDGFVIDENFPVGEIPAIAADGAGILCRDRAETGENLADWAISTDMDRIVCRETVREIEGGVQYYSPAGFNTWIGDVVTFWHDGVLHVLYLYDRHHGGSRWWCSAHSFAQLTTRDFLHWTDEGELCPHTAQWHSTGTGTMFHWGGKMYLSYGNHTSRTIPDEHLYAGVLHDFHAAHGYTEAVSYDDIFAAGKTPNGANLAVSDDGIHFTPTRQMFHWAENPSVYTDTDGTLFMCCGDGIWRAPAPEGPWRLERAGFPPTGDRAAMRNTCECPSFFEKDGYRYLLMGVTGFWRTEKNGTEYLDRAAAGHDVYDGLLVPMASNCGGRLILAGWVNGIPHGNATGLTWGSVLVLRELLQTENGDLEMRWLPEEAPRLGKQLFRADGDDANHAFLDTDGTSSEYYELTVDPGAGGVAEVRFGGCALRLDTVRREVQFCDVGDGRIPPIHERIHEIPDTVTAPWWMENTHAQSRNFSIANVGGMDAPFSVRIRRHVNRKLASTLFDVEIAGRRTILSHRVQQDCARFSLHPDAATRFTAAAAWQVERDSPLS